MLTLFKREYLVLMCLLFTVNSFAGAKTMCIQPQKIANIDEKAQAFIDDIYFNVQVMQRRIGVEEVLKRAIDRQVERYQNGESDQISFTVPKIYVGNSIGFHEAGAPKYFMPYRSQLSSPSHDKVGLSVSLIEQALGLNRCRMTEDWSTYSYTDRARHFYYTIPSLDIGRPDSYIKISVNPPQDGSYNSGDKVSKALLDNIRSVQVGGGSSYARQRIPMLSSKQLASREGLWKANVNTSHPRAELINQSSGVFLQRGEMIPGFGLEDKEERKIQWIWIDDGVEFLKERAKLKKQ